MAGRGRGCGADGGAHRHRPLRLHRPDRIDTGSDGQTSVSAHRSQHPRTPRPHGDVLRVPWHARNDRESVGIGAPTGCTRAHRGRRAGMGWYGGHERWGRRHGCPSPLERLNLNTNVEFKHR